MRRFHWHQLAWIAASSCLVFPGCAPDRADVEEDGEELVDDASNALFELSTEEIAGVLVAANDGEILQGQIAVQRARQPEVRAFAEQMLTAHGGANAAVFARLADLGTAPRPSFLSRQITQRAAYEAAGLRRRIPAFFDVSYMNLQVAAHRRVLAMIRDRLIPASQNDPILPALLEARARVAAHLAQAISVRRSIGSGYPHSP